VSQRNILNLGTDIFLKVGADDAPYCRSYKNRGAGPAKTEAGQVMHKQGHCKSCTLIGRTLTCVLKHIVGYFLLDRGNNQ